MNRNAIVFSILLLGLAVLMAFWYEPRREKNPRPDHLELSVSDEKKQEAELLGNPTNLTRFLDPSHLPHPKPFGQHKIQFKPFVYESLTNGISLSLGESSSITSTGESNLPPSIPALPIKELPSKEAEKGPPIHVVSEGPSNSKQIAITFDDGPHPTLTLKVLDILRERDIKATFFVLGDRVKLYPWILRQIVAEGHEIGNHTYSHRWLLAMSNQLIDREITETQELIKKAVGYEPHLFRPPYGSFRPDTKTVFRDHNLDVVLWSVDPKDWNVRDSAKIIQSVTNHVRNGSIILCHDIHKTTLQALPAILDTLKTEGYAFKTVSQLCGLPSIKLATTEKDSSKP